MCVIFVLGKHYKKNSAKASTIRDKIYSFEMPQYQVQNFLFSAAILTLQRGLREMNKEKLIFTE